MLSTIQQKLSGFARCREARKIIFFALILFLLVAKNADAAAVINKSPNYLKFATGLVGYWTMDGNNVNWKTGAVTDSSGWGNTGTITNMATSTAVAAGKIGQALNFDGVDDYVNISNTISNIQTVGFWVKATTTQKIINFNANQNIEVINGTITTNTIISTIYVDGVISSTIDTNWHYVTLTTGTGINGSTITIGKIGAISLNGLLDEVRVYNRALSANEIATLYNSGAAKFNVSPTKYLTDGLVGYWTMDGNNVNWATGAVTDSSGWGNTGYVTSTATTSMSTTTAPRIGKIGQALNFDGNVDLVKVGTPSSLNITGPLTISGWIYPRTFGASDRGRLVDKENDFLSGYSFAVFNPSTGSNPKSFSLFINASGGNLNCTSSNNKIVLNQWQHIAVTLNSTKSCIPYWNGVNATTTAGMIMGSLPSSGSNIFTIGNNSSNSRDFDGLIDEVRVYNRALSANEIATLYNSGAAKFNVSPTKYLTDGLVGYWTMDGNNVNWATGAVTDSSGKGNTGTITNMATSTGVAAGKIGQALNFDGVNALVNVGSKLDGLGPLTVSAWIYPRSRGEINAGTIVAKDTALTAGNWFLRFDTVNANSLHFSKNGTTPLTVKTGTSTASSLQLNIWQQVVLTWDGSVTATNVHIYFNGIESTYVTQTNGVSLNSDAGLPFGIGNRNNTAVTFDGLIDEVRVYNRALSPDEISRLYNIGR